MEPVTQFAAMRVVQGTTATLSATFVDQDGEPRTPGTVTVEVDGSDGTIIVAAGTATTPDGNGNPTVTLTPSETAQLDLLTCTWTEASGAVIVTVVEIVGGRYFTLFDARSVDRLLQDVAKYPDEDLKRVRTEVELEVERITGRSFVPRFRVDQGDAGSVHNSTPGTPFKLSKTDVRTVRWVAVNGLNYASTYWELTTSGQIYFGAGIGLLPEQMANGPIRGNLPVTISAGYEYGWPSPPQDLRAAMLRRLRSRLVVPGNTGVPDQATAMTVDGTTFTLGGPGKTGIDSVDKIYTAYTRQDWTEDFVGSLRIV